ncbi:MAG: glycosyltransferase family 39 protein [Deltaproteobacteria bacterium]|nr:glycosyltransferase family 39 protein [Deltaproteobacteria bacterium]
MPHIKSERPNNPQGSTGQPVERPALRDILSVYSAAPKTGLIALGLVILVIASYERVGRYGFVDFDDSEYIYENPQVRDGLTFRGVGWAFTTTHAANWHPLTWLSHMADVQMFGLDAGWHHWMNVLIHAVNAVLLLLVLKRMTGTIWPSALVAALFAVHPLHVESVAWLAERKDVLSTFFWLVTMALYVRYVQKPDAWRYLGVTLSFVFGLLSKPILVTLPCVLLLLDYWPLRRLTRQIHRVRDLRLPSGSKFLLFSWKKCLLPCWQPPPASLPTSPKRPKQRRRRWTTFRSTNGFQTRFSHTRSTSSTRYGQGR